LITIPGKPGSKERGYKSQQNSKWLYISSFWGQSDYWLYCFDCRGHGTQKLRKLKIQGAIISLLIAVALFYSGCTAEDSLLGSGKGGDSYWLRARRLSILFSAIFSAPTDLDYRDSRFSEN